MGCELPHSVGKALALPMGVLSRLQAFLLLSAFAIVVTSATPVVFYPVQGQWDLIRWRVTMAARRAGQLWRLLRRGGANETQSGSGPQRSTNRVCPLAVSEEVEAARLRAALAGAHYDERRAEDGSLPPPLSLPLLGQGRDRGQG